MNPAAVVGEGQSNSLKPQYGWTIVLALKVTPAFGRVFMRWRWSANAVSLLSFVAFQIGMCFYLSGIAEWERRIGASVFFCLATVLDVVDGYVAREAKQQSSGGAILDAAIDMAKYVMYFTFIAFVVTGWYRVSIICYALLVQLSLVRVIWRVKSKKRKRAAANAALGDLLPPWYRNFCIRNRLLFNPLNLEDQLGFAIFVVGVIAGVEKEVVLACLVIRICEVSVAIFPRKNAISS